MTVKYIKKNHRVVFLMQNVVKKFIFFYLQKY